MSGINDPRDADFEEANSQLAAGLKSCRSVVENYRAMLSPDQDIAEADGDDGAFHDAEPDENVGK